MSVIFAEATKDRKSVFLVANRGPALDAPTAFKERDLASFSPEKPVFLEYYGGRRTISIAHDLYVANLAAIMYSSVYMVVNPPIYSYYNLLPIMFTEKFLGTPLLAVAFSKPPSLETKESMGKLGFSTQEHRNMLQFIGPSSSEIAQAALKEGAQVDIQTPFNACSLRGFMAYTTTVKLVTSFLRVHWEAAASDFQKVVSVAIHTDERVPKFPKYTCAASDGTAGKFEESDAKYKNMAGTAVTDDLWVMSRSIVSAHSGYGPGDAIPETEHNMVFSYFDGMQLPDAFEPLHILQRYFFYSMGANLEQCVNTMTVLRKGWKSLCTTEQGKALAHLLQGINLGITIGCQVYAVIEAKRYLGFVLKSTTSFWVAVRGKVQTSYTFTQAKIDLQLASAHVKALSSICKIVSEALLLSSPDREVLKRSSVKTARGLYLEVMRRTYDRGTSDELKKWADYLNFPQEYLKVTPANIEALFSAFAGQTAFNHEVPMYLGSGNIMTPNLAISLCAAFGNTAPSFQIPKGEESKLPVPGIEFDSSKVTDKNGLQHMPFIAVYMRNCKQAAHDLEETFKKRAVTFRRGVKGGAAKSSYQFIGDNKDSIWKAMAGSVSYKITMEAAKKKEETSNDKGKKRATAEPEAGPSKKMRVEEDFTSFF